MLVEKDQQQLKQHNAYLGHSSSTRCLFGSACLEGSYAWGSTMIVETPAAAERLSLVGIQLVAVEIVPLDLTRKTYKGLKT